MLGGVYLNEEKACLVAEATSIAGVKLPAHASYFMNFNSYEPRNLKASQETLHKTAHIASICGTESVVFHTGFYLDDSPQKVRDTIKKYLVEVEVIEQLEKENNRLYLRLELSDKLSQFGNIEEILSLSTEMDRIAPGIDFAQWHTYSRGFSYYPKSTSILEQIQERLGRAALGNMHMHISCIAYGKKGEFRHLNLKESNFKYLKLLRSLKDCGVRGSVICESPNRGEDTILLKESYQDLPK